MKKIRMIFIIIVFAALALPGLFILIVPDKSYSENENRYLQTRPKFSVDKIFSGELQQELTDYFSDQFVKRDFWTATATKVKKAAGYDDIGGVFLGKDHYYFEKIEDSDISATRYNQNLNFVKQFLKKHEDLDSAVMIVPSPGTVLSDKLPQGAMLYNSDGMYKQAETILKGNGFIDIRPELKAASGDYIYYRTDHHWTAQGAYIGYQQYCKKKGLNVKDFDSFQAAAVTKDFYGTLYSKALDSAAIPDTIELPQNLPSVSVEYNGKEYDSIYDDSKLETKDKYAVFFGGNYGEVVINTSAGTGKRLMVVKDSFANSMIPYLLEDYDQIIMVDMRYYRGSLSKDIRENKITDILVLYEMSNFAEDGNLYKLNTFE
ncbi:Uncharacterised protein [uncultured Roseburia sp.]|uniref:DHHW family protein n=1 Tax=Brotonthovivens ammoniilytica TaxID=2981725 RepID=A0ABT2TNB8_9FIRM|nr:DHHW family protein [Brotonthovivens ammoniilytica]MCU6763743.1 DHHW family protein [Brotonthovivens ammoniilytica]SCJ33478.1 Uncharacterised protein [uncultured Roseburia sp.]